MRLRARCFECRGFGELIDRRRALVGEMAERVDTGMAWGMERGLGLFGMGAFGVFDLFTQALKVEDFERCGGKRRPRGNVGRIFGPCWKRRCGRWSLIGG